MSTPTQVRRPWHATLRTVFQFLVAAAVLLPFVVEASGLSPEVYPWLGGLLAIAAAVTRVMALPQVEDFLRRFAPWLAAEPDGLSASTRRQMAVEQAERNEGGFASLISKHEEANARLDEALNRLEGRIERGTRKGVQRDEGDGGHL